MKKLGKRVYTTVDGRYVLHGDPAAAFLAFTEFQDVPDEVAAQLEPGEPKARKAPPNKSRAAQGDKAHGAG